MHFDLNNLNDLYMITDKQIIDFHTHCFPDNLYWRAIATLSERGGTCPHFNGSVLGLLNSMDESGIDRAVVANIATNPNQTKKVNDFAISINGRRLIAFGSVHPLNSDYRQEINRLKANGIKGLKFHCEYQSIAIDDPVMMAIYEYALSCGMTVLLHTGRDVGFKDICRGTPPRLKNLVDAFETEKLVFAHLGGEGYFEELNKLIFGRKVTLDTSFGITKLDEKSLESLLKSHSEDLLVFGTDAPWADQASEIKICRQRLGDRLFNKLHANAARILSLSQD